jgi:hypothetical protein
MKKFCIAAISLVCLMSVVGCIIVTGNDFDDKDKGMPKEGRRVGGGLEISYVAPEDGVISLIDRKTCKSLMSKSVVAGEKYQFSAKALDPENEKKWGVDVKKADFVLYFLPTQPKPPIHVQPVLAPQAPLPPQAPMPPLPAQ